MRRRVRVGARALARIRKGGPTSSHRLALPRAAYRALVTECVEREGRRCWWCRDSRCRPLDPHHVVKRSQGGADSRENIVVLGRPCHNRTDWPFDRGKLVIRALGGEQFVGAIVTAPDKATGHALADELLRWGPDVLAGPLPVSYEVG